jgi:hypothetical protein
MKPGKKNFNAMILKRKNIISCCMLLVALQLSNLQVSAQEAKTAEIKLDFIKEDSTKTCKVTVTAGGLPLKEKEIHLYVKSLYALMPVGKAIATDEAGVALISFPLDLPGDNNSMLTVIAKLEKDETYGTVETESQVKWGFKAKNESAPWSDRSLSASREKAPMFLVVASSLIIIVIWGTIFYVVFQLFKIKKSAKAMKKLNTALV